jgi:hypothetical protein
MSLITNRGNLKIKSFQNKISLEKDVEKVYQYWKKQSFPYYPTSQQFRKDKFQEFLKSNDRKSLDFNNRLFKFNQNGLSLAWSYFPHSFEVRCNNLLSPMEVFRDEKNFKNGIRKVLTGVFFSKKSVSELCKNDYHTQQNILSYLRRVTNSQMVSNFRPITASMIYKIFCDEHDTVWDMSSGWGGRLLGSIKARVNYIGTDPSSKTVIGNRQLSKEFGNKKNKYTIYQSGSEELLLDKNSIDFAFTSPPYFNTEKYSNEKTQSFIKFNSVEKWKNGFLTKTIKNVYHCLKPNKFMILNVADVGDYNTFEKDTVSISQSIGFKLVDQFYYQLGSQQDNFKTEPMFVFKK